MRSKQSSSMGFSLIEILVAMAVLAMLMTFMFSMLGTTVRLWEQGNNQMEAAQAARIGLNRMAEDMQNAMAGSATSRTPGGASVTSIVPFLAEANAASPRGWGGAVQSATGSDQVFGVRATGDTEDPFREFGYSCVYVSDPSGFDPMRGQRYYLAQHRVEGSDGDFYLRGSPATGWADEGNARARRFPIIDNCVRFELLYASNGGSGMTWTRSWASQTNLPLGVLATVIVIDSRTAERVAQLNGGAALTDSDISIITNNLSPSSGIQTLLRNSAVVLRRFIPFSNSQ